MKKTYLLLLLLITCCLGNAHAQTYSNQNRYLIPVRKILTVNPRSLSLPLAAGSSLQAGTGYEVTVKALSFQSPYTYTPAIRVYNISGFELGCYCYPSYAWTSYSTNNLTKDTGPTQNHEIKFDIKTLTGFDFTPNVFMGIHSYAPGGTTTPTWNDNILFP